MKNDVVNSYESYKEEDRLTTDNARKVEFLTTIKILENHLPEKSKILDCAAGTGIYSFPLADEGHEVTALDITPRHVDLINAELKNKPYSMETAVNDARDLSMFADESFDAVLCFGPLYHLTSEEDRVQCLRECLRVLKKGGLLFSAYINRFFIIPLVATGDFKYLNKDFIDDLISTGVSKSDDPLCFWTDSYYHTPELIEDDYKALGLQIIEHSATDGMSITLREKINNMNQDEFEVWCHYHYITRQEKSILGISNHGLVVGQK
jgi:ubiquinone/menaquinone biosynthesis C-methylase UbiE